MAKFPVSITPEAWVQLTQLLSRKAEPGSVVRIGVKGGGCSGLEYVIKLEKQVRDSDLSVSQGETTVVCDPKSAEYLTGSLLEHTGNLIGGGFRFDNPNASRSCGCGTSFTLKSKQGQ